MHIRLIVALLFATISIVMLAETFGVDGVSISPSVEKYVIEDDIKLVKMLA